MPARQKSFFDQNHTAGVRPYRQRTRPGYLPSWHGTKVVKPPLPAPAPSPALAVSTQSRTKLKAFEFSGPGHPSKEEEGMSNRSFPTESVEHVGQENQVASAAQLPSTQKRTQRDVNDFPRTPAARVPLAELLGDNGGLTLQKPHDVTPEERVYWKHRRSPNSSDPRDSIRYPASVVSGGKKRACSSSPILAPYEVGPDAAEEGDALDLQALQKSLKTPQVDPAVELWNRYSMKSVNKPMTEGPQLPAFSQLVALSPRITANGSPVIGGAGLRRSLSCGIEWPTSKAKRRKTTKVGISEDRAGNMGTEGSLIPEAQRASKLSRVSLLVERIQESFANPSTRDSIVAGPSSSSPLPEGKSDQSDVSISPLRDKAATRRGPICGNTVAPIKESPAKNAHPQHSDGSSEFGEIDLDNIDLSMFEGTIPDAEHDEVVPSQPSNGTQTELNLVDQTTASEHNIDQAMGYGDEPLPQPPSMDKKSTATESDGFDDGDDDTYAADLERVMAEYDDHTSSRRSGRAEAEVERTGGVEDVVPSTLVQHQQEQSFHADYDFEDDEVNTAMMEQPISISRQDLVSDNGDEFDDDEFGEICDVDFEAAAAQMAGSAVYQQTQQERPSSLSLSPSQAASGQHARSHPYNSNRGRKAAIQRYLVLNVVEGAYTIAARRRSCPEKILQVQDETATRSSASASSSSSTAVNTNIHLRQSWLDTSCLPGDYVHVVGDFSFHPDSSGGGSSSSIIIDDSQNMLILHPDHLISSTVLADSFTCIRRAVLQDRVKATSEASPAQVYGNILHEVFQEALKANQWDTAWLGEVIDKVVTKRHLEDIYQINVEVEQAVMFLKEKTVALQTWAKVFVNAQPNPKAVISDRSGGRSIMSINKLLDVEEHVWSPMYGLKGNIDATVQMVQQELDIDEQKTVVVPLELKTGKNTSNISHRAQTALYTLLLSDRYDVEVSAGLLYYMETSSMTLIPAMRNEIRHMLIQRNELACYLVRDRMQLPGMLKSSAASHMCGRCYARDTCFIYHKVLEDGNGKTTGLHATFDDVVRHLNRPEHRTFLKHWDDLLTKEESDMLRHRRELWTMTSSERERLGRCFGGLVIDHHRGSSSSFSPNMNDKQEIDETPKIYRYQYTFIKPPPPSSSSIQPPSSSPLSSPRSLGNSFSFHDSQLATGEPIVVSDEKGHFALANGYVTEVRRQRITVSVDRMLGDDERKRARKKGFDPARNQVFVGGLMEVSSSSSSSTNHRHQRGGLSEAIGRSRPLEGTRNDNDDEVAVVVVHEDGVDDEKMEAEEGEQQVRYRLDKDEFNTGMATVRNNLIQVMSQEPSLGRGSSRAIRELVVDGRAPLFDDEPSSIIETTATTTATTALIIPEEEEEEASSGQQQQQQQVVTTTTMNDDQKQAIDKVMRARDYALVLGMPGTGKTTTIAHIIRALVSQGKSILLTSYTHSAVDNILLKIRYEDIPILRLGAVAKIHPAVQDFATLATTPKRSIEELREAYHGPKVVATTCLGVNHPIFNERVFDYCIVDEASQITLPVCLGPIRMARRFVLVGDHYQLPPLVQNDAAREGGLDVSLFKLLSDRHPEAVVNLEHQYRMCQDIMTLSNTLIYGGLLKCGNESVANQSLVVPNMDRLTTHHHQSSLSLSSSSSPRRKKRAICAGLGQEDSECWLRHVLDPTVKACFINTDPLLPAAREEAKGSRVVNPVEARICGQLVRALRTTGVPASDIGVITVYRSQLALLKSQLRYLDVEMHTTDRFQGRDKDVIILSLVRSNASQNIGELLKDWRRINVAFTRARTKLLVIGSRDTLAGDDLLKRFLDMMHARRWIFDLPVGAPDMHVFEDEDRGVTQVTTAASRGGVIHSQVQNKSSPSPKRKKLSEKENISPSKRQRFPEKRGHMPEKMILGSDRPVLRDIFNEVMS